MKSINFQPVTMQNGVLDRNFKWRCCDWFTTNGEDKKLIEHCEGRIIEYEKRPYSPIQSLPDAGLLVGITESMQKRTVGNLGVFKDPTVDLKYNLDYCENSK